MATLTAFEATDMRVDLWRGVVIDSGRDTIVATDGAHVSRFDGSFSYPWSNIVGGSPFPTGTLDPFGLGPVSGTLLSYQQTIGTQSQFAIDMMAVPATSVFHAVSFQDRDLATALVFAGFDTLIGSGDADRLFGYAGGDTLSGLDGDDRLGGGLGVDFIAGGDGADRLAGGRDADTIRGDDGADLLRGDGDADQLTGGKGADDFRYLRVADSTPDARDTIRDFTHGTDTIDLRAVDANAVKHGDQAFVFIGGREFTDTPGQLRYAGHMLSGDTDGDGRADFQVDLRHGPTVDAGDLLL